MRIIKNIRLRELAARHPACAPAVAHWTNLITGSFANLVELRRVFPHADQVTVKSQRTITIFNLSRSYRLITAIHYNAQRVFILRLLTHAEYDKNHWKNEL